MLTGKLVIDKDRRYSIMETAKVLGIGRSSVYKYIQRGDLHAEMHVPTKTTFCWGADIQKFYDCTI